LDAADDPAQVTPIWSEVVETHHLPDNAADLQPSLPLFEFIQVSSDYNAPYTRFFTHSKIKRLCLSAPDMGLWVLCSQRAKQIT
jgi:hypothetical protein